MAKQLTKMANASIFNSVRSIMSQSFRDRIPEATVNNIKEVGTMITSDEFEVEANAWQKALFNRIGLTIFNEYLLENPLAHLIYGTMKFGDAIQEIALDIVKGAEFNPGEEGKSLDPFIVVSNPVLAEYHRINKPIQYMTTVKMHQLEKAFLDEGGLSRLLSMFVSKLYSSANVDTWTLTKMIMAEYINERKTTKPLLPTQKIHADDVIDKDTAEKFILQVKNALSAMAFPNNTFNPQQIHKTLDRKSVVLFLRADVYNAIGVKALSAAFNIEELNMDVEIEKMDDFGVDTLNGSTDDVLGVLAEKWWLLITQQFNRITSQWNARGLYWNYFLTRAMSFGASYFKDVIIFAKRYPATQQMAPFLGVLDEDYINTLPDESEVEYTIPTYTGNKILGAKLVEKYNLSVDSGAVDLNPEPA